MEKDIKQKENLCGLSSPYNSLLHCAHMDKHLHQETEYDAVEIFIKNKKFGGVVPDWKAKLMYTFKVL